MGTHTLSSSSSFSSPSSTSSSSLSSVASPLQRFVSRLEGLVADTGVPESRTVEQVTQAMRELVSRDDWLDPAFTVPHPEFYQQFLLHDDPQGRFSVVSFVWGPGQQTPVHDHCTWGVIGMLRGAEIGQLYRVEGEGLVADGPEERLEPGDTGVVSPATGDIHVVRNAFDDRVSISIHAYGASIGRQRRHVYDRVTGVRKEFISGYSN